MNMLKRFRGFLADQNELAQRQNLLNRPWEEDLLHWAHDGDEWHLHGRLAPPRHGRHSTTSSGWCPGLAARERAARLR